MMRSNARFWIGTIILGVFLIAWLMGESISRAAASFAPFFMGSCRRFAGARD
jgi:hypothetical protein